MTGIGRPAARFSEAWLSDTMPFGVQMKMVSSDSAACSIWPSGNRVCNTSANNANQVDTRADTRNSGLFALFAAFSVTYLS